MTRQGPDRRFEGAGHPVTWDEHFPGHARFYVADPWGNRLERLERRTDPDAAVEGRTGVG